MILETEKRGYWKLKVEALDCTLWRFALEKDMDLACERVNNK
jgi:hypothetical protein